MADHSQHSVKVNISDKITDKEIEYVAKGIGEQRRALARVLFSDETDRVEMYDINSRMRLSDDIIAMFDIWKQSNGSPTVEDLKFDLIKSLKELDRNDMADEIKRRNSTSFEEVINYVAQEIGRDWERLARKLGLSKTQIASVHYTPKAIKQAEDLLISWVEKNSDSATISALMGKLDDIGRRDIAHNLENGLQYRTEEPQCQPMDWGENDKVQHQN